MARARQRPIRAKTWRRRALVLYARLNRGRSLLSDDPYTTCERLDPNSGVATGDASSARNMAHHAPRVSAHVLNRCDCLHGAYMVVGRDDADRRN